MSCACETQDRELRRLRDRLHASTKANTEHRARIRELEGYRAKQRTWIKELAARIEELKKACTVCVVRRVDELEERNRRHVEVYEKRIQDLKARVKELKGDNYNLRADNKTLDEENARMVQKTWHKNILKREAKEKELRAHVKDLEGELRRDYGVFDRLRVQVKGLEYERKDNAETIKKMRAAFDKEHVSGINLVFENHELEEHVKKLEGSCADCTITKKYASLGDEHEALHTRVRTLEEGCASGLKERSKLMAEMWELAERDAQHDKECGWWTENARLMKINKGVAKENTRLRDRFRDFDSAKKIVKENERLKEELGDMTERRDGLRARARLLEDQVARLIKRRADGWEDNNRIRELEGHIKELRASMAKDLNGPTYATFVTLRERYNALKGAVLRAAGETERHAAENTRLAKDNKDLRDRVKSLEVHILDILACAVPSAGLHNALRDARKLLKDRETPPLGEESAITNDAQDGPYTNPGLLLEDWEADPFPHADDINTWRKE